MKQTKTLRDKDVDNLALQKLNDMLSNVDLHKIVSMDKIHGIIYIGGERADNARLTNLKAETEFLLNSDLWSLLHETPKELAQRAIFVQGDSLDDLRKGRAMLYTLSTQKNILDTFKNYNPK